MSSPNEYLSNVPRNIVALFKNINGFGIQGCCPSSLTLTKSSAMRKNVDTII